ncbi:MAG: 50S ribosomal protein L9 [Gammaproteobacteria bacterium]|nr:50S ribosomal protein L9 [Gammaproteobacteria bacterium]
MEVILLDQVENLGDLGDKVQVKPGYARNYLIPQGRAKYATVQNIVEFEAMRADLEQAAAETMAMAQTRQDKLENLEVSVTAKVGGEGKLFGSVGTADIAKAITAAGLAVEKREVRLPSGPLRQTGEYEIELHLHTGVDVNVKLTILAEE